jgi:hypothetical protein
MIFGRKDRVGVSGRCRRVAVVLAVGMIVAEAEAEGESVEDSAMSFSVDESVSITLKGVVFMPPTFLVLVSFSVHRNPISTEESVRKKTHFTPHFISSLMEISQYLP